MSRTTLVSLGLLTAVALTSAACASETGIVIEVTRDETTTPKDIEKLRFFVGIESAGALGTEDYFVDDADLQEDLVDLQGRDLLSSPYKLLLREGKMSGEKLMVAVVGLKNGEAVGFGMLADPVPFVDGKVVQWPVLLKGDMAGRIDVTETNCLFFTDDAGKVVIAAPQDLDCDGDPAPMDCDDSNPNVGPSSPEKCDNDVDDDCDDETDEESDVDMDGVTNCDGDCDDTDDRRFPGNPEICDGVDNDCNEVCDDGELDRDGDKFTVCSRKILPDGTCTDESPSLNDCRDDKPEINPDAEEVCDGIDNNCDNHCDEGFDPDNDTFTSCGSVVDACQGTNGEDVDCGPMNPKVHPGAPERCDGVDSNCDGELYPETVSCYGTSTAGEPICQIGIRTCDDTNGIGWTGDCQVGVDNGAGVPNPLCDKYENCELNDNPDPFQCANDTVAMTHSCTVYISQSDEVCANAEAVLPPSATGDAVCFWSVQPASIYGAYDVVLRDPLGLTPIDETISVCRPNLLVRQSHFTPAIEDRVLVHGEADGATSVFLRVDLQPMKVTECPPVGMSCVGLTPPAMAGQ